MNRVYYALGFLLIGFVTKAQINSDRPGFTNSSSVLKARTIQIESGAWVEWQKDRVSQASIQVPTTNLRWGINPFVEARITMPSIRHEFGLARTQWDDLRIGFKAQIVRKPRFELSAITEVYFLEEAGGWVTTPLEPRFVLYVPMSAAVGQKWVLKSQLGLNEGDVFDVLTGSFVVNRQIGNKASAQMEYVVASWYSNIGPAQFDEFHLLNISAQSQVSEHLAIDITYGTDLGLNNDFGSAFGRTNINIGVAYNGIGKGRK